MNLSQVHTPVKKIIILWASLSLPTVYGGLIASGWHTCGLFMRLFVEYYLPGPASLGSPGVDELRWLKPVRPGDGLTLRITVHKVKSSRSKPDRGVLFSFWRSWGRPLNYKFLTFKKF
jgi:acyl dehydratase